MAQPLRIDVWSDIACPWCFIGKRRLEKAIAQEPSGSVEVVWHAFQLQPDIPKEGVDAKTYFAKKFGGAARVQSMFARVTNLACDDGLCFKMDDMKAPNTRLAHQVIAAARHLGVADAVVEALFAGHFEQGRDVGKLDDVLALLAERGVAVDLDALRAAAMAPDVVAEVEEDLQAAGELGIDGVPFFLAGGVVGMSGAQEPETFRMFLEKGREMAAAARAAGAAE
jgi:predicted DsbA family dithiol-disulfide isomerase